MIEGDSLQVSAQPRDGGSARLFDWVMPPLVRTLPFLAASCKGAFFGPGAYRALIAHLQK
jgi:hypothetical protein